MATVGEYLGNVQNSLIAQLEKNRKSLPNGFQKDRFILNCITLIQDMLKDDDKKKKLGKISVQSITTCFLKGAVLGLDFFNGECYAIPYGDTMNFQTDYKGEIKLNKKYSKEPIRNIFAKVVREGDEFYEEINEGDQNIYFKPIPFNDGDIIGAFAIVKYKDGSMAYETMSKKEIEGIRNNFSKAANSKAWSKTPGEMYKKTVLRRLCKTVDLDFDNVEQMKAYEDGADAEFKNEDQIIDVAATETVNVFDKPKPEQASLPQKPEPVKPPKAEQKKELVPAEESVPMPMPETDFAQFEKGFEMEMSDEELPFR